ncbi:MAG: alpha/beta family hydrolase [Pannonibacter sp.]
MPPVATLLFAHGAGAAMDSSFMNRMAAALAENGVAVARFEFPYMAARRGGGKKAPPPKAELLVSAFQTALQQVMPEVEGTLLIGGKSMGGRVAAMLAGGASLPGRVKGVACVGYPFHPTGKADVWRLEPLAECRRPVLITQGERDPFGSAADLDAVALPDQVAITYLEDGNHDLGPRGQSPATWDGNIHRAAEAIAAFAARIA